MRRVFFSFHHKADSWRAGQVRNMWVARGEKIAGFSDSAEFEKVERQGDQAIKNWINNQLKGTSVTVVLIGSDTLNRKWVKYEITQSILKGNGLLGIHINQIRDQQKRIKRIAKKNNLDIYNNPAHETVLDRFLGIKKYETKTFYDSFFHRNAYNWISHNIGNWIETSARKAGR